MSWSSPGTAVTGQVIAASFWNTNGRDNLNETAPAKVTTAGDIVYATAINALARLGIGSPNAVLKVASGGTAPEWGTPTRTRIAALTAAGATVDAVAPPEQVLVQGTNQHFYVLKFDKATDEIAHWHWPIPPDYVAGNVAVKFVWYAPTLNTGDVVWAVQTLGVADSETWDAALGAAQSVTETTDGTAGDLSITSVAAFNPGWAVGDVIAFKAYRDANAAGDTLNEDAYLLMVLIEYTGA